MIARKLKLPNRSFFLFGPRLTGKSTLVRALPKEKTWIIDLLDSATYFRFAKTPAQFRREAESAIRKNAVNTIVIDEVQRLPMLLNDVQSMMQDTKTRFILTGSSTRKLKRGGANLLAGRAEVHTLHPFIEEEIREQFELEEILKYGSLPPIIGANTTEKKRILRTYVHLYLREEIQDEGIVRNLAGFSRFLDIAGAQCGELLNYSNIGRECSLHARTVQSYYDILEDTLIGFRLHAWRRSASKRMASHPKFYLFDTGVTNALNERLDSKIERRERGRLFEQWVILETMRHKSYLGTETRLFHWRTNHGSEVDLIFERHGKMIAGIEIKSNDHISGSDLTGLRSFRQDHPEAKRLAVCTAPRPYDIGGVEVLPWQYYIKKLPELLK